MVREVRLVGNWNGPREDTRKICLGGFKLPEGGDVTSGWCHQLIYQWTLLGKETSMLPEAIRYPYAEGVGSPCWGADG